MDSAESGTRDVWQMSNS